MDVSSVDTFLVKEYPLVKDINTVCRCCLASEKLQEIFVDGGKLNVAVEVVLRPAYIPLSVDDGLPNLICACCVEVLQNWHRFRLKCDESHKLLERLQEYTIDVLEDVEEAIIQDSEIIEEQDASMVVFKQEELNVADEDVETTCVDMTIEPVADPFAVTVHKAKIVEKQVVAGKKKRYIYHRQCPICGIVLKRGLREHIMVHNDPTGRPFKCDRCDKTYCRKENLRQHQEKEHLMIRYPCDICGKIFSTRDVLNAHRKLHTTDSFKCDQCDQAFKSNKYLYKHKQKHLGIKKFVCSYCGKSFLVGEYLKDHLRIHTGEKPFDCKICGKVFRTTNHLRQHNRTHLISSVALRQDDTGEINFMQENKYK